MDPNIRQSLYFLGMINRVETYVKYFTVKPMTIHKALVNRTRLHINEFLFQNKHSEYDRNLLLPNMRLDTPRIRAGAPPEPEIKTGHPKNVAAEIK